MCGACSHRETLLPDLEMQWIFSRPEGVKSKPIPRAVAVTQRQMAGRDGSGRRKLANTRREARCSAGAASNANSGRGRRTSRDSLVE